MTAVLRVCPPCHYVLPTTPDAEGYFVGICRYCGDVKLHTNQYRQGYLSSRNRGTRKR